MRLKSSEKRLLILLGLVIIVGGFLNFLFLPLLDEYTMLAAEKSTIDEEYKSLLSSELTDNQLKGILQEATMKYEKLKVLLPPVIHQEEAILYLTEISKKHQLKIEDYQFSNLEDLSDAGAKNSEGEAAVVQPNLAPINEVLKEFGKLAQGDNNANVNQYKDKIYTAQEADPAVEDSEATLYEKDLTYFSVTMKLSGSYKDFKGFVGNLEAYKNKIIIQQINISKNEEELDKILGTITMAYPIFNDQENIQPYQWSYDKKKGVGDPFTYTVVKLESVTETPAGETVSPTDQLTPATPNPSVPNVTETPVKMYESADFHMSLKPVASDASTVTFGKTPYRYSELYSDNDGIESLSIQIKKQGAQYLYQYANSLQSYPDVDVFKEMSLSNKGKLVLVVQSQGRMPSNDNAGVMLSIRNDSGLPLEIYVYDDDKDRPRFSFNKISGTVKVLRP